MSRCNKFFDDDEKTAWLIVKFCFQSFPAARFAKPLVASWWFIRFEAQVHSLCFLDCQPHQKAFLGRWSLLKRPCVHQRSLFVGEKKPAVEYLNGRDISETSFPFVWWTILQSLTQWGKVLCGINAAQDILISMLLIKNVDWVLSFLNYPGTGNSICLRINHLWACLLSVQKPRG